jgi:hypothetical protein
MLATPGHSPIPTDSHPQGKALLEGVVPLP